MVSGSAVARSRVGDYGRGYRSQACWEVVRKGSRFRNLPSPFPSGEPPAEDAVAFSTRPWGWVGPMLWPKQFFWENIPTD